jgi:hypothetical protein
MATRAFHQEVVSRMVTDAEDQQSANGWRARNDSDAKCVLARAFPARRPFSLPHAKVEAGDLRERLKHGSSYSTSNEGVTTATATDGTALPLNDALPSRYAMSNAPRAAGYRGSDFVLWHI